MRITISKENYLKAIAEAQSEGETVKAVTLSRWLHVSAPAVTMAIKRLKRDGLIRVGKEGQIALTVSGRKIAVRVLNRHHLIERMLAEIFGLEWYKVHDEAEHLEHAVSADFECKLAEKLGDAKPGDESMRLDSPQDRRRRGLKPLSEAQDQERLEVARVFDRDRGLLEYLDRMGIRPGAPIEVIAGGSPLEIAAEGCPIRVPREIGAKIWVHTISPRRG